MKICQINGGVFGSTGKIMFGISNVAKSLGMETICFSPVTFTNRNREPNEPYIKIGTYRSRQLSVLLARITGLNGCFAHFETLNFLKKISEFKPDIIHLHNLHDSYINLPMLFKYIKRHNIQTVWTLHDCWAFTGHCPYFDICECNKWQKGCNKCPQKSTYPQSLFDNSRLMYRFKKKWFTGVKNLQIITPSYWLADMVKRSFLKDYSVRTIHNGIDLNTFSPTDSDFRKTYNLENKKIVLGASFLWCYRKGLDIFIELSKMLNDDYAIVLVGTNEIIDKQLPKNIISIHHIKELKGLAKIYSAADVFVNPTREEIFGLVNVEALACGTPVITFDTGGSVETIDESCGIKVEKNDVSKLCSEIVRVCQTKPFSKDACIKHSKAFNANEKYTDTIKLYSSLAQ